MKAFYLEVIHSNIIQRCTNPKHPDFKFYGGRGISVFKRWQGKQGCNRFIRDILRTIGPRPEGLLPSGFSAYQIDRIDNNLGYFPGNLRWATTALSQANKRKRARKKVAKELGWVPNVSASVISQSLRPI